MNLFAIILDNAFTHALGWTIIHSLWQGAAAVTVLVLLRTVFRKASSVFRYNFSVAVLLLLMVSSTVTFLGYYHDHPPETTTYTYLAGHSATITANQGTVKSGIPEAFQNQTLKNKLDQFVKSEGGVITFLWITGVILLFVRLIGGIFYNQRLKKRGIFLPGERWQQMIIELTKQAGINKKIRLFESAFARVPMVVGWFKPVILLPAGALTGIPADQLETVIMHELAHIRRNDILINLLQTVVEIILFFNPAVWYISSAIRKEREHCCDDAVLIMCGKPLIFAKALRNFQEIAVIQGTNAAALAGKKFRLLARIQRIVEGPASRTSFSDKIVATMIMMLTAIMLLTGVKVAPDNLQQASIGTLQANVNWFINDIPGGKDTKKSERFTLPDDTTHNKIKQEVIVKTLPDITGDSLQDNITLKITNDSITEFRVNGQRINPKDFDKYASSISHIKNEQDKYSNAGSRSGHAYTYTYRISGDTTCSDSLHIYNKIVCMTDLVNDSIITKIDVEKIQKNVQEAMKELNSIDREKLVEAVEKARAETEKALEEIDQQKIRIEIEKSQKEVREAVENWKKEHKQELEEIYKQTAEQRAMAERLRDSLAYNWEKVSREIKEKLNEQDWQQLRNQMEELKDQIDQLSRQSGMFKYHDSSDSISK